MIGKIGRVRPRNLAGNRHQYGAFHLFADTHPSTTDDVYACFDTELERIRNGGIEEEELTDTVTRLRMRTRSACKNACA